jgi:hypothetical protein
MNGKGHWKKQPSPKWSTIPPHARRVEGKYVKTDRQSSGRDSKRAPPECESRATRSLFCLSRYRPGHRRPQFLQGPEPANFPLHHRPWTLHHIQQPLKLQTCSLVSSKSLTKNRQILKVYRSILVCILFGLLTSRPNIKVEDDSLSAVRDCYPPYLEYVYLHPQPEEAPCHGVGTSGRTRPWGLLSV